MKVANTNKPILLFTNNHFDLTWRRCWKRPFIHRGITLVSYTDLQAYFMDDNLAFARRHPEYRFEAESTAVVRAYVERRPERFAELRRLAKAGRFMVTGAGENIIDANMVLGESIIRNFLLGYLWVEKHLGVTTKLGFRCDAFGNSAQLPQIFRNCGIRWVNGFSYSPVQGDYWRGLDGSTVCVAAIPSVASAGGWDKYAPCPVCRGLGCRACAQRGIKPDKRSRLPGTINDRVLQGASAGAIWMAPEELLPNPGIFDWVRRNRRRYSIRFAVQEEMLEFVRPLVDRVDAPPPAAVHPSRELNPNNSGVWVTRIKTKQTCRRQEYTLLAAETLCALAGIKDGRPPVSAAGVGAVWQDLLFTMFHDAVTGTHVDAAYAELQDFWRRIDRNTEAIRRKALQRLSRPDKTGLSVFNPCGSASTQTVTTTLNARGAVDLLDESGRRVPLVDSVPAGSGRMAVSFVASGVPALSARTYRVVRSARRRNVRMLGHPVIENGRYRIEADAQGIVSVFDKVLRIYICRKGAYRPNGMILERDEGSPWATIHPDCTRMDMADNTRLTAAEAGPCWQRLTFECEGRDMVNSVGPAFHAVTRVMLTDGVERVDVTTRVAWDTYNLHIRVAMPVAGIGRQVYGIPYGMIARRPYKPVFGWSTASGGWPAVNWAGVESSRFSVAMFNKGLPGYMIERAGGGTLILLSLLRSPSVPTYLHDPDTYSMTDFDGMRDAGEHLFEYALCSYRGRFANSSVVPDSEAYNAGLMAVPGRMNLPQDLPRVVKGPVRLAALKWAEAGQALIVRLAEFRGAGGLATVSVPTPVKSVARMNMLEREAEPLRVAGGTVTVKVRPWEIISMRMELGGRASPHVS